MAWTYLAESGDSVRPWSAMSSRLPTVKTTLTPKECFCLGCITASYPLPPFGMMCELCAVLNSLYSQTYFTPGFLAKILVSQVSRKAWTDSKAAYLAKFAVLQVKPKQSGSSLKTLRIFDLRALDESSKSWTAWGMTVDGVYYQLPVWDHRKTVRDGSFWPTPAKSQIHKKIRALAPSEKKGTHGIMTVGAMGSRYPETIGGYLNPKWVEWLMGYSAGWTGLEPWAMRWFRRKRGKRSSD